MDFSKFYDEQHDYAAFRSDPKRLNEYKIAIQWKVQNLVKQIPASVAKDNVLEVGCALGILLNSVADKLAIKVRFGIDISTENIDYAKKLYPDCSFVCGTIEDLQKKWNTYFPLDRFDIVILSDIVEHIPDDEQFLREVSQISRYVIFNLPLEKCYNNRNRKYGETDPSGHLRNYDLNDAKKLVDKGGFEVVTYFTDNAHFDKTFFYTYSKNRQLRVKGKKFHLRLFWQLYYFAEGVVRVISPTLYKKKYGSNLFAVLKAKGIK
jgi:SAM-dependent methyltransferase